MIPPISPTGPALSMASTNHLIAGSDEALSQVDQIVTHQGTGQKFVFQLPDEVAGTPLTPNQSTSAISSIGSSPTSFGHLAQSLIKDVNNYQETAGEKVRDVLRGGPTTVHDAMIAVQESTVAFQLLAQVRNKLIDSYQELNRMQI